ncbi:MAG: hypothetical protein ING59_03070 [Burkholderiales bacterium]|nr:hypothetical protein [Burkholderiales bacterium]
MASLVAVAALGGLGNVAWAQRPANPIARPPRPSRPDRPDRPIAPGRFYPLDGGGVAQAPVPGMFTVVAVDSRGNTLQLRDYGGRSGTVLVAPDLIDLDCIKPGDVMEVDFLVPDPGSTVIAAAGIWKLAPVSRNSAVCAHRGPTEGQAGRAPAARAVAQTLGYFALAFLASSLV